MAALSPGVDDLTQGTVVKAQCSRKHSGSRAPVLGAVWPGAGSLEFLGLSRLT